MRTFTVSIQELEQQYGGPEEGGWWYDSGTPAPEFQQLTRTFKSARKAWRYRDRLQDHAVKARAGRPYWSAAYAGGDYRAVVQKGTAPRPFPTARPYYE